MKKVILSLMVLSCLLAMRPSDNFIAILSQKMEAYYQNHPQEQAQLIFSQEKYTPSDTAFFQTYLLNEDFTASIKKQVLTLGIFSSDGKMVQKINFAVFGGYANNQIIIPPDVLPGIYLFTVYNPEIKDVNTSLLYSKEISVVGKNKLLVRKPKKDSSLAFAFEGGNFISGTENRIILKSALGGAGKIKNNRSQEVAQFVIGKDGIASTLFTPQTGESYYAEIDGTSIHQPLAIAKEDGCTMRVTQYSSDQSKNILISVPLKSALRKKELYLIVTNRKKIVYSAPIAFDNNAQFQVIVPSEYLKNGLSQATVFNADGTILAERIFLSNKLQVFATITSPNKVVHPRDKIDIEFNLRDKVGNSLQGDFSVSVFQKDFFSNTFSPNSFEEEVLLENLFYQIKKEFPDISSTEGNSNQLDDALAMKNDGLIPWSEILNNAPKFNSRFPNNLKIRGKAIFKNSGKIVPDSTLVMGYLQNAMVGYEAYTTKDGFFEMPFLYDFWGSDELFYLMEYKGKEMSEGYQIIHEGVEFKTKFNSEFTPIDSIDAYGDYGLKKKIVEQCYNFFSSTKEKTEDLQNLNSQFEEEAMGADFTVNVQDYVAFPTMEDLVREVIPYLQHRKKSNGGNVKLLLKQNDNSVTPKGEPLFLIDGVLTKNKDFFLSLKPIDVLTIKLINNVNKLSHFGVLGKNGVVLVETKKSVAAKVLENSSVLKVQGLSKPLNAQVTAYSKGNLPRVPDLRSILYWNPLQQVDKYGKSQFTFHASDNIGTFGIIIKGITKQGDPFEAEGFFEVAFDKTAIK
jgi:hypothetical protein